MNEMDSLELQVKIKVEGQKALDQAASSTKSLGNAAKSESQAIDQLAQIIDKETKAGKNLNDVLMNVVKSTDQYSQATKKAAADTLQNLGVSKQVIDQYMKTGQAAGSAANAIGSAGKAAQAATQGFKQAGQAAGQAAQGVNQVNQAAQQLGTQGNGFLKGFLASALGLGVAGSIGLQAGRLLAEGLKFVTIGAFEAARETKNFADRINATYAQARQLQNLGSLGGVNSETLASSTRIIAQALEDQEGAGKKAADAFKRLGIETQTLNGETKTEGTLLLEIIEKLGTVSDKAERAREANAILGRGSKEILPLIDNYSELNKVLQEYGVKVDENVIEKGDQAFQHWNAFLLLIKQLRDEAAKGIGPIVVKGIQWAKTDLDITKKFYGGIADLAMSGPVSRATDASWRFLQAGADVLGNRAPGQIDLTAGGKLVPPGYDLGAQVRDANARGAAATLANLPGGDVHDQLAQARKKLTEAETTLKTGAKDATTTREQELANEKVVTDTNALVKSLEEQIKSQEKLKTATNAVAEITARSNEAEQNWYTKLQVQREDAIRKYGQTKELIDQINAAYDKMGQAEAKKFFTKTIPGLQATVNNNAIREEEQNEKGRLKVDSYQFEKSMKQAIVEGEREVRRDQQVRNILDNADREDIMRQSSRTQRMISLTAAPGIAGQVQANNESYTVRLQLAQELYQKDMEHAAAMSDVYDQEVAKAKAIADLKKETSEAELDREMKLLELQKQQLDQYRGEAGRIFDSIKDSIFTGYTQGVGYALRNMLKDQLGQVSKQVFTNLATPILKAGGDILHSVGPTSGILGTMFQGTVFGGSKDSAGNIQVSAANIQLKAAAMQLAAAGGSTSSIPGLSGSGVSGLTGGGEVLGLPGGGFNIPDSWIGSLPGSPGGSGSSGGGLGGLLGKILGFGSGGFGGFGSGLKSVFSGYGLSTLFDPGMSMGSRIGAGAGLAGAIGGGIYGITQGISSGGPGGALTAVGSGAALAGTAVSNISKLIGAASPALQAAGPIGDLIGAAAGLIGSFLPNGKEIRQYDINTALSKNQYLAPTALNVTQSSNGNYIGFDARGNLNESSMSAIPTVAEPYITSRRLNGPTLSYFTSPGGITSPYSGNAQGGTGNAPVSNAPNITIHVNSIDTQTGVQFLLNNHQAIGEALTNHIYKGESPVSNAIRFLAGKA